MRARQRCGPRSATLVGFVVAVGLASAFLGVPAHAEVESREEIEERDDGSVTVTKLYQETSDGPAPAAPASVDELELVDAAKELLPATRPPARRFPACPPPDQRAQTTPAVGEVHSCSHWTPQGTAPEPTGPGADPEAIARRAAAQLLAQPGAVGILPARTLTGLPTYYWLDGTGRRQTTRTQAGLTLHIQAIPVAYEWAFGDGTIVHGGPGADGPPGTSDIRHIYRRSDHYQVSATVTWSVTFGLNGQTYELPDAFTTTATTDLAVDQLRARLTG
jgi:PKD domain